MATQKKIIACGKGPTVLGMFLRFIVGPAIMAFSSFVVGLRGNQFHIAIIQVTLTTIDFSPSQNSNPRTLARGEETSDLYLLA